MVGGQPERSGVNPWLLGLAGYALYRRGRKKRQQEHASARSPATATAAGAGGVTQVVVAYFAPDASGTEEWRPAHVDVRRTQQALELTVRTVGDPSHGVEDLPIMLVPIGGRWRVAAIDAHATGGRLGPLPAWAVARVGRSLRTTQAANGQLCAVPGRIRRAPDGSWTAEVLLAEQFEAD
jgi:hypothetical protein